MNPINEAAQQLDEVGKFQPSLIEKKGLRDGVLLKVGGIFQRADTKNHNGRVYPKQLWQKVLNDPDVNERIKSRKMTGMLGHPASGETDPEKVSHVITRQELRSDGTVYGEAEILDTPTGRIAATLFKAGIGLGVSSRGRGSTIRRGGEDEVQSDYQFETHDFVIKPSTPGAYPGIVESVEAHEASVVKAIRELVESEIPGPQRLGVLLECQKILSVLESDESSDGLRELTEKIKMEVNPETILVIEAEEPSEAPAKEEETMNPTKEAPTGISADMLEWHRRTLEESEARILSEKQGIIDGLKDDILAANKRMQEAEEKVKAAESVIEDLKREVEEAKEDNEVVEGEYDYQTLQVRYAKAVELLDEAILRLPEIGESKRRIATLEGLVEAAIARENEANRKAKVDECLSKVDETEREKVGGLFEGVEDAQQVETLFKAYVAGRPAQSDPPAVRHEPLPESENQKPAKLDENQSATPRSGAARLTSKLVAALA